MKFISVFNKGLFRTKTHRGQKYIVVWKFTTLGTIGRAAIYVFAKKGKICI